MRTSMSKSWAATARRTVSVAGSSRTFRPIVRASRHYQPTIRREQFRFHGLENLICQIKDGVM